MLYNSNIKLEKHNMDVKYIYLFKVKINIYLAEESQELSITVVY